MAITQPTMQSQDDLVTMFDRTMVLDPSKLQHHQPPQEAQVPQVPQITYSITQHYNHSAHVARQQQTQQCERRFSEPQRPQNQHLELILLGRGIDPSSLSQAQCQLFKEADESQRRRLLELWSICPPANSGSNNNPALAWSNTSLDQEEQLARMRYEQHEQLQRERAAAAQQAAAVANGHDGPTTMSLDGTTVPVPFQGGDGRWMADENQMTEPYMLSGYETLARREYQNSATANGQREYRPATDPAYQSTHSPVDWARRQRSMENQYGAFTQCRMEY